MTTESTEAVVVGAGQAGLAMSEHLSQAGVSHVVLERSRIVERWRSERWDSLVANGPAWHDRFPSMEFSTSGPDDFPSRNEVVDYFEAYAAQIEAPVRCGVDVLDVQKSSGKPGFVLQTTHGTLEAQHVIAATGPFQCPVIPPLVPSELDVLQLHSNEYRNPEQLPDGAVLVVGAGSSGSQIASELLDSGRDVYLSVGRHDRPPRRYRGRDFVWWLGVLGKWDAAAPDAGTEHVTISVSGAHGGHTVDFRRLAAKGMTLLGLTESCENGTLRFAADLADSIAQGDRNYLSVLDEADAYIERNGLDFPLEPAARDFEDPARCITHPVLSLDIAAANVRTILWATGYTSNYDWLNVDVLDTDGRPRHQRGVSDEPGIYFLGLPWQSRRGSSFIWGVWHDAKYLADQIVKHRGYMAYRTSS